jgi:nitroreductase
MEFKEIVMKRYATKKFDGRKISEKLLGELMDVIRHAPSSMNIQPWKIKVVSDEKTKKYLYPASNNQQQIITCSHLLIFCANTDVNGIIDKIEKDMISSGVLNTDYIKSMRSSVNKMNDQQLLAWTQRQLYIALGNAVNGAKSLGFDSCPMEGFDPQAYSRILKLPKNIVPTALCPIGYGVDKPREKTRFKREEIFF